MTAATAPPALDRAWWRRPWPPWAAAVALAVLTLALHARVGSFQLTFFDDDRYLTDNPQVQGGLTWAGAAWAWTTLYFSNWHPLTWLSWQLDVSLFGFEPGAFHLVNAALHAVNAALLLLALARLTGAPVRSALAAALFALHPIHVEAVAWASERKELLAALFGLLALLAYARHATRPSAGRLALVALAFAASLASKPTWVTLPFLLLVLDAWPLRRPRRLLEKVPLLALSLGSSIVTVVAQQRGGAVSGLELGLGARAANALVAYARYLGKALWPADLSIFYPHPAGGLPAWQVAGAALLLAGLSAMALWRRRSEPWLAAGWCWFLGTLVPVIGLVQVGGQAMADRYTYLPGIGLYLAAAWGAERLGRPDSWRQPVQMGAVAILLACAAGTWRQLGFWTDHQAVFRHAIEVDPDNGRAHGSLAYGLWRAGRRSEALDEERQAVLLSAGSVREWVNLAEMLRDLGRHEEALRAFREATRSGPGYAPAWSGLGAAEAELGHLDEAVADLRRAAALDPGNALTWRGLGEIEAFRGRQPEASRAFREALRITPEDEGLRAWLRRLEAGAAAGEAPAGAPPR